MMKGARPLSTASRQAATAARRVSGARAEVSGKRHLVVPYTPDANDFCF